jgi:hypothetical protein
MATSLHAPDWLKEWAEAVGTDLTSGLAEGPLTYQPAGKAAER